MFVKPFLAASSKRTCNQVSIIPLEGEEWSEDDTDDTQPRSLLDLVLINVCMSGNAGVPNDLGIQIISNSRPKTRTRLELCL